MDLGTSKGCPFLERNWTTSESLGPSPSVRGLAWEARHLRAVCSLRTHYEHWTFSQNFTFPACAE